PRGYGRHSSRSGSPRQRKREHRSSLGGARHGQCPTVCARNLLHNGQSHPGTWDVTGADPAVEALNDASRLRLRNDGTGIGDRYVHVSIARPADLNRGGRWRILEGVVEQLAQRQREQFTVRINGELRGYSRHQRAPVKLIFKSMQGGLYERSER